MHHKHAHLLGNPVEGGRKPKQTTLKACEGTASITTAEKFTFLSVQRSHAFLNCDHTRFLLFLRGDGRPGKAAAPDQDGQTPKRRRRGLRSHFHRTDLTSCFPSFQGELAASRQSMPILSTPHVRTSIFVTPSWRDFEINTNV